MEICQLDSGAVGEPPRPLNHEPMEDSLKKVLIINGHQPYPFAKGRLNGTFAALMREHLERRGYQVEFTEVSKGWDVETEVASAPMGGRPRDAVPRTGWGHRGPSRSTWTRSTRPGWTGVCARAMAAEAPVKITSTDLAARSPTRATCSLTFNAPRDAFGNPNAAFFEQRTVDDLPLADAPEPEVLRHDGAADLLGPRRNEEPGR